MGKTTMFILCPGKDVQEIEVPFEKWDLFEKFVEDFGQKVSLRPGAAKKLFLVPNEEKLNELCESWTSKHGQ